MNSKGTKAASVIVVEDNEILRQELVLYLSDEGFAARGVDTGEELNRALQAESADILILDLNLPEEDGIDIARRIRNALPEVGIVMLTARMRANDRLEGYAAGADVYLTKPTRPKELVAVINNLFARLRVGAGPAPWQLDMAELSLRSPKGARIELSAGEARLLKEFALCGQYLDLDTLQSRFGDASQSEKINKARLEVAISRLRAKLGPHLDGGFDIKSLRGQGYRLGFVLTLNNLASGH